MYIRDTEVEKVYFVVSWFPTVPWFSMMTELLIDFPILLPPSATRKLTVAMGRQQTTPIVQTTKINVGDLSGNAWRNREIHGESADLMASKWRQGTRRRIHTSYKPGTCLTIEGRKIQVYSLQKKLQQLC